MSNFMKIRPVGAELFHADGLTDMVKLIVAFRNFANAPIYSKIYKCFTFSFRVCSSRTGRTIVLYNCVLPDDGPVWAEICRIGVLYYCNFNKIVCIC